MARAIYEMKLKEGFFPALSGAEALHMQNNLASGALLEEDVTIRVAVTAEHTLKMFTLCKTMYDTEKYTFKEIHSAIKAVATEMGYFAEAESVADMITTWTERVGEDMPLSEFEEWLLG